MSASTGANSDCAAATSVRSRTAAPSTPYAIAPRTTRASTITAMTTISTSTPRTLTGGGGRGVLGSVPLEGGAGIGGALGGQLGRLVDHGRPAQGGDHPARPAEIGGAQRDGETAGRVVDRRHGLDRVVVGHPAGAPVEAQPEGR